MTSPNAIRLWPGPQVWGCLILIVFSVSGGVLVPLVEKNKGSRSGFPGVPAARPDIDVGLGGGMIAVGVSRPVSNGYSEAAVNLRGALLRTWLWSAGEEKNRT